MQVEVSYQKNWLQVPTDMIPITRVSLDIQDIQYETFSTRHSVLT